MVWWLTVPLGWPVQAFLFRPRLLSSGGFMVRGGAYARVQYKLDVRFDVYLTPESQNSASLSGAPDDVLEDSDTRVTHGRTRGVLQLAP